MDYNNNENTLEWNVPSTMNHNVRGVSLHSLYVFLDKDSSIHQHTYLLKYENSNKLIKINSLYTLNNITILKK